jgi:hypothetical protein
VKNRVSSRSSIKGAMSRRKFLGRTATAAIGFSIVPRQVLGGTGNIPPSDRVNIGFIGAGAQGLRVMLRFFEPAGRAGRGGLRCKYQRRELSAMGHP